MKKLPFAFILFFFLLFLPSEASSMTKEVSVLLEDKVQRCTLAAPKMQFIDSEGKKSVLSGTYTINKKAGAEIYVAGDIFRLPVKVISDHPVRFNGTAYAGIFVLRNSSAGFRVSNIIDIEEYLRGVIKAEMDPRWPIEAVKAQCVLARTFAVKAGGKHGEDDLCDTYHCQVYKGISAHDALADRAVKETSGLILRWNGNAANVYYHSDSGGMVTSTANVWGGDTPYLKPKAEPFAYSGRNTVWETTLSLSSLQSKLSANGIHVGNIISITPVERDETGRILKIEIRGSAGIKVITGHKFRNIAGTGTLKSTLFEFGSRSPYINEERGQFKQTPVNIKPLPVPAGKTLLRIDLSELPDDKEEKLIWMTKKGIFTTLELMEILSKPHEYDNYLEKGIARAEGKLPLPEQNPETSDPHVTGKEELPDIKYSPNLSMASATGKAAKVYGRGSGHGVGMSQWGAKAMAEKGWTFIQILGYYFPGTTVGQ